MPTLTPGVYDPSEAPWWEFSCAVPHGETFPTVRKQWMGEAARHFAEQLAARSAGGKVVELRCISTQLDGSSGLYEVQLEHHRAAILLTVYREYQVSSPDAN